MVQKSKKLLDTPILKTGIYTFVTIFLTSFISLYNEFILINVISISFLISLVITFLVVSMIKLSKIARDFYYQANKIEKMILNNENKDIIYKNILLLSKKSFHRETHNKLLEIYRMYEIKYGIKILK